MQRSSFTVLACAALLSVAAGAHAEDFYKYKRPGGRVVYTNITEQVPLDQRESGKLDLSKVPLNSELGKELDRGIANEHAALRKTAYCEQLLDAADDGLLERIWEDFAPLVVCGGVLLLFVLFTPFALRNFGAPVWAKTLMMAIPSLAIAGLVTFTMTHTNKTIVELKQRVKPCALETFDQLKAEPDALAKRSELVEQLKREIETLGAGFGTVAMPHDRAPE